VHVSAKTLGGPAARCTDAAAAAEDIGAKNAKAPYHTTSSMSHLADPNFYSTLMLFIAVHMLKLEAAGGEATDTDTASASGQKREASIVGAATEHRNTRESTRGRIGVERRAACRCALRPTSWLLAQWWVLGLRAYPRSSGRKVFPPGKKGCSLSFGKVGEEATLCRTPKPDSTARQ